MGNTKSTGALVRILVSGADCTVILDADALNAVSADEKLPAPLPGRRIVITPHPGEMARLCGCSIADIKAGREEISLDYAKKNGCIVVLKEHRTLIASPEGELWRNTSGNSGLARGGSGDILAGMLAAFAAQGMKPLDAALCAVYLHGAAADRCAKRKSETAMLPHDIFKDLGKILRDNGR